MRRSRFTQEQIVGVLKEHEAGAGTSALCRRHGIDEVRAVALSFDDHLVASGSADGTIRLEEALFDHHVVGLDGHHRADLVAVQAVDVGPFGDVEPVPLYLHLETSSFAPSRLPGLQKNDVLSPPVAATWRPSH